MDMEKIAKLEALQNSGTFEQELAAINSPKELQSLFAKHGIEMTMEEINDLMVRADKLNTDELSAEDLDDVAGGVWYVAVGKWVLKTVASWLIGKALSKATGL